MGDFFKLIHENSKFWKYLFTSTYCCHFIVKNCMTPIFIQYVGALDWILWENRNTSRSFLNKIETKKGRFSRQMWLLCIIFCWIIFNGILFSLFMSWNLRVLIKVCRQVIYHVNIRKIMNSNEWRFSFCVFNSSTTSIAMMAKELYLWTQKKN